MPLCYKSHDSSIATHKSLFFMSKLSTEKLDGCSIRSDLNSLFSFLRYFKILSNWPQYNFHISTRTLSEEKRTTQRHYCMGNSFWFHCTWRLIYLSFWYLHKNSTRWRRAVEYFVIHHAQTQLNSKEVMLNHMHI